MKLTYDILFDFSIYCVQEFVRDINLTILGLLIGVEKVCFVICVIIEEILLFSFKNLLSDLAMIRFRDHRGNFVIFVQNFLSDLTSI